MFVCVSRTDYVSCFKAEAQKGKLLTKQRQRRPTLLKKSDTEASAESTVSSSIQLGLAKLLLGKLRPVCEPAKTLWPWKTDNSWTDIHHKFFDFIILLQLVEDFPKWSKAVKKATETLNSPSAVWKQLWCSCGPPTPSSAWGSGCSRSAGWWKSSEKWLLVWGDPLVQGGASWETDRPPHLGNGKLDHAPGGPQSNSAERNKQRMEIKFSECSWDLRVDDPSLWWRRTFGILWAAGESRPWSMLEAVSGSLYWGFSLP